MTFYLTESAPQKRFIISSHPPKDTDLIDSAEAYSWVEAKQKLGFPLTDLQKEMLLRV